MLAKEEQAFKSGKITQWIINMLKMYWNQAQNVRFIETLNSTIFVLKTNIVTID